MAILVGEAVSRVKNVMKAVKEDSFMTDRFVYSLIMKYGKTLIKRENDLNNLFKNAALFKEIPCVELIEVDKINACCTGLKTGCTFRRSKNKLPKMIEGSSGPIIRAVTTLDYSISAISTTPGVYTNMTKSTSFKYNKNKYYWIIDGYLFVPDVDWESIRLQAIFDEDISYTDCGLEETTDCILEQDRDLNIPEDLFSEIENYIRQELLTAVQLPPDGADDSQNVLR